MTNHKELEKLVDKEKFLREKEGFVKRVEEAKEGKKEKKKKKEENIKRRRQEMLDFLHDLYGSYSVQEYMKLKGEISVGNLRLFGPELIFKEKGGIYLIRVGASSLEPDKGYMEFNDGYALAKRSGGMGGYFDQEYDLGQMVKNTKLAKRKIIRRLSKKLRRW